MKMGTPGCSPSVWISATSTSEKRPNRLTASSVGEYPSSGSTDGLTYFTTPAWIEDRQEVGRVRDDRPEPEDRVSRRL